MDEVRPVYHGTYKRLLIPPVIVIGLGRFGSRVCDEFFTELDSILRPAARGDAPPDVPRALADLIGRLAIVRKMDAGLLPLSWAGEHVYCWDAALDKDNESQDRFDLDLDLNSNVFWRVPISEFHSHAPALLDRIGGDCSQLMNGISNISWARGRELLGLPPLGSLDVVQRWVIAVGSLCEPDVAAVAPLLRDWSVHELVHGAEALCANMSFLDCGLPDHPSNSNRNWQQCPGPIVNQLLSNITSSKNESTNISWFLTDSRVDGIDTPESVRRQVLSGLLKAYTLTLLFNPRRNEVARRSTFLQAMGGNASKSSRAGVYVEATLATDNLEELVAQEVLAEWKRRVGAAESLVSLDAIRRELIDPAGPSPQELVPVLISYCRAAINQRSQEALEGLKTFLENEKCSATDALNAEQNRAAMADALPAQKSRWWEVFRRGGKRSKPVHLPSATARLEAVIKRYTVLQGYVDRVLQLVNEVVRPEGVFHDRIYDHHLEACQSMNKLYLRYKRIPLDACPPEIRRFVESVVSQIDAILLQILLTGNPTVNVVELLTSELKRHWTRRATNTLDAEETWQIEGIASWLAADPSLQRSIAEFAYTCLMPLWRFFPGRNSNWKGHLTVLDFGGRQPTDLPHELTDSAVNNLVQALKNASDAMDPLRTLDQQWSLRSALNSSEIYFEAWPFYHSIGLLWTEYPMDGFGFGSDYDSTQLESRVQRWRAGQAPIGRPRTDSLAM
jgi:hypothetical protein